MPLSCCASTCAELSTALRAADESGLVASACTALVKLLNTVSSELSEPGVAVDLLQPLIELRAQVGIGAAGGLDPQLALHVLVELAIDRGDPDADADAAGRASSPATSVLRT